MNRDKNQMSFDEQLARPIKPAPEIREPFLWFQSLHLVRQLGVGDTIENRIRHFTFRRGLNILWAEPEDPETSEGLYGDGFAGHSTGKTLFCRILRHLLGEPNFGTSELEEHVRDTFQELWAVASVRLNGKTWLVGRPLAGPGAEFAIEGGEVTSVFAAEPPPSAYKRFTDALETECGSPLAKMHPAEAWRNLLPWIARDQEARFSTITAWRDSSSEADNPRSSREAQHLILRAVLRLLEPDEFDIRHEIAGLEEQIKARNASLPMKQTIASRDLAQVVRALKAIPKLDIDLLDLKVAKQKVISQREIREEALEQFRKQPESPEVQDARRILQEAISAKATADARIALLGEEIPKLKAQADKSLLTVDRIKKSGLRDPKRVSDGFCPNSYLKAVERECVPKAPDDLDPSMVEIRELEDQAKELATTVQQKEAEKARLESQADQLSAAVNGRRRELSTAIARFPSPAIKIDRDITLLRAVEADLESAILSAKEESDLNGVVTGAQNTIVVLKERLARLKSDADKRLRSFSDLFADIVRAVLGAQLSASADLGERAIHIHVKRTRELGGAAVES